MFVLCPHCQFLVALEPATGQPPEQCPRCRERLQPMRDAATAAPTTEPDIVVDAIPEEIAQSTQVDDQVAEVVEIDVVAEPASLPDSHDTPSATPDVPAEIDDVVSGTVSDRDVAEVKPAMAPAMPMPPATRTRRLPSAATRRRLSIASVPLLALLLLLQSLLSDRTRLAADARWRPLMTVLCNALPCTLPPWREPAAITLLERDVRPDPHRPGVLHVSAGFRNDARWSQPWPALLLTLSDADGRVAGARAFRPDEYLVGPATKNGLASGQSAKVSFDVMEPTRDVVAFSFDFR